MVAASSGAAIALDANYLVKGLVRGTAASQQIRAWVQEGYGMAMSAVAWSEYLCGPVDSAVIPAARQLVRHVDALDVEDAEMAARLLNDSGRRSRSHTDCMIAAHAIRRDLVFATLNASDFRPFQRFGLRLA
jgi:predicted nucleic acid-binding protein